MQQKLEQLRQSGIQSPFLIRKIMKRIYLIAGVMVAIAIALLVNSAKDMSTYGSFADANTSSKKIKIAGKLAKNKPK